MSINTPSSNPSTSLWNQIHWHPSQEQLEQFLKLHAVLKYWNSQVNLTRLIDGNDFWIAQIFDSLWPLKNELKNQRQDLNCVDVGSGCGFPGLAVAIALPQSKVTLIEATSRKTKILQKIATEIGLSPRIIINNERVETTAHKSDFREGFDLAMARAVALPPVVSEYLVPLLNKQGEALIYRGKLNELDLKKLSFALQHLNAKIKNIEHIQLPETRGERHVIRVIRKGACSNKYPRSIGIPVKKPLGS